MASPQAVNRQVALALGRVIIPAEKSDSYTHADGVEYLYSVNGKLWRFCETGTGGQDEFNPAESPADALACLEEWCDKKGWMPRLEYSPGSGKYHVYLPAFAAQPFVGVLPEAICQSIIHAAEIGK